MIYECVLLQDQTHPPVVQNNVMMIQHQVIRRLISNKMEVEDNFSFQNY